MPPTPVPSCAFDGHVPPLGPMLETRDRQFPIDGAFTISRCRTCGLAGTTPRLQGAALARHYPPGYGPHEAVAPAANSLRARLGALLDSALYALSMRTGAFRPLVGARPGRLLDVGCGRGLLASWFARRGWATFGIEPDGSACDVARSQGVTVHRGTLDDHPHPPASFDAVTFDHVLEHVPDPLHALRSAHDLVRPGGTIVVSVPNFAGWQRRVFRSHWFHLDAPRHLQHFDRVSLGALARRAGLEVVSLRATPSATGLAGSLQYAVWGRRQLGDAALLRLSYLTYPLIVLGDAMLGEPDCLHLVARRP